MCDITQVFTAIRKVIKDDVGVHLRIMREMELRGRDEYLAMKACGYIKWEDLDYKEAYMVLGQKYVDEWIECGTFTDQFDYIAHENLDYWCDPTMRQKYYEEYMARNTRLRRTGSVSTVRLHPNFTLAEIEYSVRNAMQ